MIIIRSVQFAWTRSDLIRCAFDESKRLHTQRRIWNGNNKLYGKKKSERENKTVYRYEKPLNSNRTGHAFMQRYRQTALNKINLFNTIK